MSRLADSRAIDTEESLRYFRFPLEPRLET